MSRGMCNRLQQHGKTMPEKETLAGMMMADLEQNPGFGASSGPLWPVQLTHGQVVCMHRQQDGSMDWRLATPLEHFTSQGFHVLPPVQQDFKADAMVEALKGMSPSKLKMLAGNGQHLPVMSAWIFYILSNIALKQQ